MATRLRDENNPEKGWESYDREATVEFDVIERPLNEIEEEIAISAPPDVIAMEGLDKAIDTWGMGV